MTIIRLLPSSGVPLAPQISDAHDRSAVKPFSLYLKTLHLNYQG
jgi:hypothetical protein